MLLHHIICTYSITDQCCTILNSYINFEGNHSGKSPTDGSRFDSFLCLCIKGSVCVKVLIIGVNGFYRVMTGSEATADLNCDVPVPRPHLRGRLQLNLSIISDMEYFPVPPQSAWGCSVCVCHLFISLWDFFDWSSFNREEIKDDLLPEYLPTLPRTWSQTAP